VLSGPTFTVDSTFPYNVSPQSISMLVGQSRTISVTNASGAVVTGLQWINANPNVISLSTDDPPVITALAPGSAIVYAGEAPISVTVYAGTALPAGTPVWSVPTGSNGSVVNPVAIPAVPSGSGADVFVLGESGGQVLASDGTLLQTFNLEYVPTQFNGYSFTAILTSVIPDFSGNAVLKSMDGETHQVSQLNVATGAVTPLYTFSGPPANYSSTPYDYQATQTVIPDTTGKVFIQDNDTVLVMDPSTGATIGSVTLEGNTIQSNDNGNFPDFVPAPGNGIATFGKMIVAGDGNAYLPYAYTNSVFTLTILTDTPSTNIYTVADNATSTLRLLRVAPDGTYAKIDLNDFTLNETNTVTITNLDGSQLGGPVSTVTCSGNGSALVNPIGPVANQNSGQQAVLTAITNGGTGAAAFVTMLSITACSSEQTLHQIDYVSQDSLTSQVNFDPGLSWNYTPVLQRADGSYIGTDGLAGSGSQVVAAVSAGGGILWSQQFPVTEQGPIPLYATADGGVIVTSTPPACPGGDLSFNNSNTIVCQSQPNFLLGSGQTQLGTLYTLDQNGNITSSAPDPGTVYSWKGAYEAIADPSVQSVALPMFNIAQSFAAVRGGNLTGNGFSLVHHTFGIVFCGLPPSNGGPGGDGACVDANGNPIPDTNFVYEQNIGDNNYNNPALIHNFETDYPNWVSTIKINALNTYINAFAHLPAIVIKTSSFENLYGGTSTPPQFEHTIYVRGDWVLAGVNPRNNDSYPPPGWTPPSLPTNHSFVYYLPIMGLAQQDLGPNPQTDLSPGYPPTSADLADFQKLVAGIGTAIGNVAAHETGWELNVPYMGCNTETCEDNNQLLYQYYNIEPWFFTGNPEMTWGNAGTCAIENYLLPRSCKSAQ